ncbi:MAG TPA: YchJ family metal-binding protein [Gammaproteobacteria bacterium]|jgi:SEC-C motif-containing protein|nr:YchJ family metal-binding protein [Gammaproteobacteria bacterium]
MMKCPCGSQRSYRDCCEKFISGKALPETAEELMRSRYSAFATHQYEYIADTMLPPAANHFDLAEEKATAGQIQWIKLEVIKSSINMVEFRAYFRDNNGDGVIHERSRFVRKKGKWYYVDGMHF